MSVEIAIGDIIEIRITVDSAIEAINRQSYDILRIIGRGSALNVHWLVRIGKIDEAERISSEQMQRVQNS